MTDDRAEKIAARLRGGFTSETSTLMMIKEAALFVLQRDGSADWERIEARLVAIRDATPGELGAARSEAAIAHLKKLAAKKG